jgi:two-component system, LytTR family, sensor kinase
MMPPMIGTFIIAQCGCLVKGFENWFANLQIRAELENRNLRNELELLKSQINPHFLFNSLNNIDSLIRTSPEDASGSLITLSEMLRYILYDTNEDKVDLQKEIVYIKNYIKLQQLRFRDKDYVNASFPGNCNNILVAPMLFIPFIENAFKYSINMGALPVIDIYLECTEEKLLFSCKNYYKKEQFRQGGIGLENTKRRLELLYPGKYDLKISDENPIFKVELSIRLK